MRGSPPASWTADEDVARRRSRRLDAGDRPDPLRVDDGGEVRGVLDGVEAASRSAA